MSEHAATESRGPVNAARARMDALLRGQEKTLTGAFWFGLVVGGIATLALIVTFMGNAAHSH